MKWCPLLWLTYFCILATPWIIHIPSILPYLCNMATCTVCGKLLKYNLLRHMRTHEAPDLKCMAERGCPFITRRCDRLLDHLRNVHKMGDTEARIEGVVTRMLCKRPRYSKRSRRYDKLHSLWLWLVMCLSFMYTSYVFYNMNFIICALLWNCHHTVHVCVF